MLAPGNDAVVITDANFDDSGRYQLRAVNTVGSGTVQFGVNVQCKCVKFRDREALNRWVVPYRLLK